MKRIISWMLAIVLLVSLVDMGSLTARAASDMKASEEMIGILMKLEGFVAKPYWDNSQYSVGYGTRPLSEADRIRYTNEGISKEEARELLDHYLTQMGTELNAFNDKYGLNLTQGEFDALLSLSFNCGTGWLYQDSTLRSTIIARKKGTDLLFAMGQWSTSGGKTSRGHVRRRLIECNMYLNGAYSMTVPENYQYVVYDNMGGTAEIKVQCFDANVPVGLYSVPTRYGYTFAGWYTAETGGQKITELSGNMGNPTIYARWSLNGASPEANPGNTSGTKVTVTATDVNLRGGPGTNYDLVGKVNRGDILTISDTKQGSDYLWGNTGKGWIALKYTNYVPSTEQTPAPETTPAPTDPPVTTPAPTDPPVTTPAPTDPPVTTPAPTDPPVTTPAPTDPPVTTPAPTDPPKTESVNAKITVTATDVNLRKGPGTGYQLVGKADKGDTFTITETAKGGDYLWGNTGKGWIALKYTDYGKTQEEDKPTTPPQEEDKPTTPPQEDQTPEKGVMGTITGSDLRIRKGPSTGYAVVGYLNKGDRVEILDQKVTGSMTWGKTSKGWISMTYVKLDNVEEETDKPSDTPVDQPTTSGKLMGTITGNSLRIRSGAGITYAVKGYLNKGDRVEILDQKVTGSMTWGKTSKGWISMDYVKLDTVSEDGAVKFTGKTTSSATLRVRSGPHDSYSIVAYLSPNTPVTITQLKTIGDVQWGKMEKGWVKMDYIVLDGQTEQKPEANVIQGTVTASLLYVRQTAGVSGKIVGGLYKGTKVEILQTRKVGTTTWGQTTQGWISMDYVKTN